MYITEIPNRKYSPTILLRESFRDKTTGKTRVKTVANLTRWDPQVVKGLKILLKGGTAVDKSLEDLLEIELSHNHGHVAAILGTMTLLELEKIILPDQPKTRNLVFGMIAARMMYPKSKLYTKRRFSKDHATDSLARELEIEDCSEDDLYRAMDELVKHQEFIEKNLAKKHLKDGSLVLYDLTSAYMEGTQCPLAQFGYSRDKKRGKLQIEFGLLCDQVGRPIAVKVFDGNVADATTVDDLAQTLHQTFGLSHIVLVGDRGMITQVQIDKTLKPRHFEWITALNSQAIRKLIATQALQPSSFDERDICEITHVDYPEERLVACFNYALAKKRKREREFLLKRTEEEMESIVAATRRKNNPLRDKDKIGIRLGKVKNKYKVGKHFTFEITNDSFEYKKNEDSIKAETALDGIYVVRTSVSKNKLSTADEVVRSYKSLALVEQAFRCIKTVNLKVRPIYHWTESRVRAHIFLCMLAYYIEWHMQQKLAPLLFKDDQPEASEERQESVVQPAQVSVSAQKKALSKKTEDQCSVQSWQDFLDALGSLSRVTLSPPPLMKNTSPIKMLTTPTKLHKKAFKLLGIKFPKP